ARHVPSGGEYLPLDVPDAGWARIGAGYDGSGGGALAQRAGAAARGGAVARSWLSAEPFGGVCPLREHIFTSFRTCVRSAGGDGRHCSGASRARRPVAAAFLGVSVARRFGCGIGRVRAGRAGGCSYADPSCTKIGVDMPTRFLLL